MFISELNVDVTRFVPEKRDVLFDIAIIAPEHGLTPNRRQCWDIVNWTLRNKI